MSSELNPPRTIHHHGVIYHVTRLYSSGLGAQYAATWKNADGKEQTILLTEQLIEKDPSLTPLFTAAAKRFDDSLTFAKYVGASSF